MITLTLLAATAPPTLDDSTPVEPFDLSTWGFGQWVAALGIVATLLTLYVQFRRSRSDEVNGKTSIKMTLDKMIDERVERNLTMAYKDIDDLKKRVGQLESEKSQARIVVRRMLNDLRRWDEGGRVGPMPMPSEKDLELFGLDPWDTAQANAVEEMREEIRHQRDGDEVESYE